jgi:PBP1b-binding outer membrane lipoprotein LpoB
MINLHHKKPNIKIMKNLFYISLISVFLLSSCCGEQPKEESGSVDTVEVSGVDETAVEVTEEVVDVPEEPQAEVKDDECSKFLDEYEEWANNYIDLLERFKTKRNDPNLAEDYRKLSSEMSTWTNDWFKFVECSKTENYQKRYNDINAKIEQKTKELQQVET